MTAEWWGVVITGIIFLCGLLGNIITSVWWASKITTSIDILSSAVGDIKLIIAKHEASYVTKVDFEKDFGHLEKKVDAAWVKIDKLQEAK
jgi:hypothetical protein